LIPPLAAANRSDQQSLGLGQIRFIWQW